MRFVLAQHSQNQKCESGSLFDTKMPAALCVGYCVLVVAIITKFILI